MQISLAGQTQKVRYGIFILFNFHFGYMKTDTKYYITFFSVRISIHS